MAGVGGDIAWAPTHYRFAQCAGDKGSGRADTGRAFGVMLGKYEDTFSLMPLTDPAGPTRIAMNVNNGYVERQLFRRAAVAGERVAVYDETGQWTMTSGSSRFWTGRDFTATPLRPPTLVVHNVASNAYPGARASVARVVHHGGLRHRDHPTRLADHSGNGNSRRISKWSLAAVNRPT